MIRKGFSIVELLLYMGLMSILLVLMGQILFAVLEIQLRGQASSDVQQDGEYILARIGYDVRRASAIVVPATPGQAGNTLELTIGGVNYYTYGVSGSNLQLTAGGIAQNLTSFGSAVSNFTVTEVAGAVGVRPSVDVSFTLTSTTTSLEQKSEVKDYEEVLTLR